MSTTTVVAENKSFSGLYQHAWDSTSLGLLKTCPYKYFLANICGWQKPQIADALIFGIAFHRAAEVFEYRRAQGHPYELCLRLALRAALKKFVGTDREIHRAEKKERNIYALLRAICWYFDEHTHEGQKEDPAKTHILPSGEPAAELSFRFLLPDVHTPEGDPVLLCGHIDRIADMGPQTFVTDYKTTGGQLNSRFFDGFSPSNQMSLYDLAGSVILGKPIAGVLIDGIKLNVHSAEFGRGFAPRSKEQREEFLEDTRFWIELSFQFAQSRHWPMNEQSCGNYGGCEFREVCNKPASLREGFLQSRFTRRVWDPLVAREDDEESPAAPEAPPEAVKIVG